MARNKNTVQFNSEDVALNQEQISLFLDSMIRQDGHPMPVCLCGVPGIGKSQIIQGICRKYGITWENGTYHEVRASLLVDSSDVTGLPIIQKEIGEDKNGVRKEYGHTTKYSIPDILPVIKYNADGEEVVDTRKHVLFFDELNRSADPSIMNAIFQLTTEFRVGQHKLVPNCVVLLAINPENTGYAVNEMCPALVNRINFQYMKAEPGPWLAYARKQGINSVITDFISTHTEHLSSDGIVTNEGQDKRFPTPRAWFNVDKLLKTINLDFSVNANANLAIRLIAGIVGLQSATEFVAYARTKVQDRPITGKEVLEKYCVSNDLINKVTELNDMGERNYDTVKTTTTINSLKEEILSRGTKLKKAELVNLITFLDHIAPENALAFQSFMNTELDTSITNHIFSVIFDDDKLTELWNSVKEKIEVAGIGSQSEL